MRSIMVIVIKLALFFWLWSAKFSILSVLLFNLNIRGNTFRKVISKVCVLPRILRSSGALNCSLNYSLKITGWTIVVKRMHSWKMWLSGGALTNTCGSAQPLVPTENLAIIKFNLHCKYFYLETRGFRRLN